MLIGACYPMPCPIQKNKQKHIFRYIDATKPTEQRRAKLLTSYFFVCQCVRCTRLRSKRKWTAISEELVERQAEQGT